MAAGVTASAVSKPAAAPAGLERCPAAGVLRATLHETVRGLHSQKGTLSSTRTAGFAPPTSANHARSSGSELTCTYLTRGAPIAISFVVPVDTVSFDQARAAARRTSGIVILRGLPASAWAAKGGGELFARLDGVGIIISAPEASASALGALASRILAH
jgi:hypothetical protein